MIGEWVGIRSRTELGWHGPTQCLGETGRDRETIGERRQSVGNTVGNTVWKLNREWNTDPETRAGDTAECRAK